MGERAHSDADKSHSAQRATASTARPAPATAQTRAIALQRTIGNRATARILSRWAAHPDKDKKGVLMTDEMAAEYNRFNPPLSK